jgi:hypothetical protein
MKKVILLGKVALSFLFAYVLANWWFASAWSEKYWSWLNNLLGGHKPGLASDIELVSALAIALVCSFGLVFLLLRSNRTE